MPRDSVVRERKPLFALALSLIVAGMGQVYNGKPRKGILFFAASLVLPLFLLQLSVVGPDQTPIVLIALFILSDPGISVWAAIDAWKQAKRSGRNYRLKSYNRLLVYILLIAGLNLLVFGLMSELRKSPLLAATYRAATESMAPTILPGDLVLADQRIDRSSENLGLRRGELVVFKYKKLRVTKRIIGLPGDEVELRGMELSVNGVKWTSQEASLTEGQKLENAGKDIIARYEKSEAGVYEVFYSRGTAREDFRISVPENRCFVLGDNRDISADSRHWGAIPLTDIVARPRIVYFSSDPKGGVRWGRIGKSLKNTPLIGPRPGQDPAIPR
jgi:signal peptidase I